VAVSGAGNAAVAFLRRQFFSLLLLDLGNGL